MIYLCRQSICHPPASSLGYEISPVCLHLLSGICPSRDKKIRALVHHGAHCVPLFGTLTHGNSEMSRANGVQSAFKVINHCIFRNLKAFLYGEEHQMYFCNQSICLIFPSAHNPFCQGLDAFSGSEQNSECTH